MLRLKSRASRAPLYTTYSRARYRRPPSSWMGSTYHRTRALLEESQHWSEDRHLSYQMDRLRTMLSHCATHVPYYRELFSRIGFNPVSVESLDDLSCLPTLHKETVRENLHLLRAENVPDSDVQYFTTGGTSGRPLGFFNNRGSGERECAFMHAQWARVGFTPADHRALLRGRAITNRRHWTYDPQLRAYCFSNFHMTPENVAEYDRVIRSKSLKYLHSYPSAIIDFARRLAEIGREPPHFNAIFASSENLYAGQREFAEAFYSCRLFSWYGHSENLILAGECECSTAYHIFPEYGLAEIVAADGTPTPPGQRGELVGTTLDNFAMPLVRYRTGDFAAPMPNRCDCGRPYSLLADVEGRWLQEMLVGRDDNLISVTALNLHTNEFDHVEQLQFRQSLPGRVDICVKPHASFSVADERRILLALRAKMGDTMDIALVVVEDIPLTTSGKFRFVVHGDP